MNIEPIAFVRNDFKSKFGVPRQSGMTKHLSRVVFGKEYSAPEAFRGLDGYDYVWLIWGFDRAKRSDSLTVRPPRLGGNERVGVFATRSPFRPNGLGLSSVRIVGRERNDGVFVLVVEGADMADGTPVYDVKPYLAPYDSHPDARSGFAEQTADYRLSVRFSDEAREKIPDKDRETLSEILSLDPRPSYQEDGRTYGFTFSSYEIKFTVNEKELIVTDIIHPE